MKLLVKNAKIIKDGKDLLVDLLIEDGKISKIGPGLEDPQAKILDAKNKRVLPGALDVHTHMELDQGAYVSEIGRAHV